VKKIKAKTELPYIERQSVLFLEKTGKNCIIQQLFWF